MSHSWLWRSMGAADLSRILPLADALFPDHPEDFSCFAERLALGGDFCLILADETGDIVGYAVAYPWPLGRIPPLNRPLGAPGGSREALYLHDLAVHPGLSGRGYAGAGLALLVERARMRGATVIALVAVNDSAGFWRARGFTAADAERDRDPDMAGKLASYGQGARYMVRVL